MTVSNQLKLLSLGMLTLAVIPTAFAQSADTRDAGAPHKDGFQGRGHHGKHGGGCHMYSQLGLSAEQKAQMKSARETFRQQNASAFESMKAKHQQLREMRKNGKGDSAEAQALRAQLKTEWQALAVKKEALNRQILTPEQFQKMKTLHEQCKTQHHGDRKENLKKG